MSLRSPHTSSIRYRVIRVLDALGLWPKRVPFIPQQSVVDCAVACLRMVLAYFGRDVDPREIRTAFGVGRDGSSALTILRIARVYGLNASFERRVEPEQLAGLPMPAILHWDFKHFVVLERFSAGRGAFILDPARGRRWITHEKLSQMFTGVVLLFEPGEAFVPSARTRSLFVRYMPLLRRHWRVIGGLLLLSVALQAVGMLAAKATQVVVDEIIPHAENLFVWVMLFGMALIAAVQAIYIALRSKLLIFLRMALDFDMSMELYRHTLYLPYEFTERRSTGDVISRVAGIGTLRDLISVRVVATILDASVLVGLTLLIAFLSPRLAALVIGLGIARAATGIVFRQDIVEALDENLAAQAQAQSAIAETVGALMTVKASGAEDSELERWRKNFVWSLESTLRLATLGTRADAYNAAIGVIAPSIVLCFCAMEVIQGRLTLGAVFGLAALSGQVFGAMLSLAGTWESWQRASRYGDRVREVLDEPAEQPQPLPPMPPLRGEITMTDVSYRYSPRAPDVLSHVSLMIPPGAFIAVMGESGSGKSTLLKLLLGLYAPTAGEIRVDGLPPLEHDLPSFRRQTGSVVQEARLFSGSIQSNIVGISNASFEAVVKAAQIAEIHDDIDKMPMGYETVLTEGGSNISGGQRQRIALARALAANPAILVLDEATSALDAVLEAKIIENLSRLRITRFVVAHRLSTTWRADRIFVMADGKLVESGTHDDLLRKGGTYAALVTAQQAAAAS